MKNPTQVIVIDITSGGPHFRAHLLYNSEDTLGKGTFKTAIAASLEFDTVTPSIGLGSVKINDSARIPVALKRPFLLKVAPKHTGPCSVGGASAVLRMGFADEQHAVSGEAKLLVWANALLNFTYAFIFDYLDKNDNPPNENFRASIPSFRFVQAGVAVALKPMEIGVAGKPSSQRATYLLEEKLPGTRADFVKYMNNAHATSILERDDPDYHLAEFLMFVQHVQYEITHKVAYLSDFQGTVFLPYLIICLIIKF
jgi:hypothetical protein